MRNLSLLMISAVSENTLCVGLQCCIFHHKMKLDFLRPAGNIPLVWPLIANGLKSGDSTPGL